MMNMREGRREGGRNPPFVSLGCLELDTEKVINIIFHVSHFACCLVSPGVTSSLIYLEEREETTHNFSTVFLGYISLFKGLAMQNC